MFRQRHVDATKIAHAIFTQQVAARHIRCLAGDHQIGSLAAADVEDQACGDFRAGLNEARIDAALETVAGIGLERKFSACRGGAQRIEQGGFEEAIRGLGRTTRSLAAHDAAEALGADVVGDHRHGVIERIGLAVERLQRLAGPGKARADGAPHLGRIEDVQGPAVAVGDVVGDVDQCRNGPQADGLQAALHPLRRRAVPDPTKMPANEQRARLVVGIIEGENNIDRRFVGALERLHIEGFQASQTLRGEVAGDAVDPQRVRAVGGDLHVDHRVVHAQCLGRRGADGKIVRQLDDAGVLVGQLQFALGTQHASGFNPADGADLEIDPGAGDMSAGGREDADKAGFRIGGAAHHLHEARCGFHIAHPQAIRIGMLAGFLYPGDSETFKLRRRVGDLFHFEADADQAVDDLIEAGLGVEVVLQPCKGKFHVRPPDSVGTCRAAKP